MTTRQQATLLMWKGVLAHLKENRSTWEDNPAFVQKVAAMENKVAALNGYAQVQLQKTNGVTGDKHAAIAVAAKNAMVVVNALQVLAGDQGDGALAGNLDYTLTALEELKDSDRAQVLQWIAAKAAEKKEALAFYGIGADELESFASALEAHNRLLIAPRSVQKDKNGATSSIAGVIREGNGVIEQIDKLVENLQSKAPDMARAHEQARKIIVHGIRHNGGKKGGNDEQKG